MSNDHDGIADDPRNGQQQETEEAALGIAEANEGELRCSKTGGICDERKENGIEITQEVLDALPAQIREELMEGRFSSHITEWAGDLPDPDSFARYPEYAARAIVSWGNARIVDESKRLDKLVEASIGSIKRDQWMAFALNALFAVLSFAAFVVTGSVWSFGLMAVPVVSVVVNVREKDKEKGE